MADLKNEKEELRTMEDLFRQKRFSDALKIAQRASHDYPGSFQIQFLYVRILKELNKLKEAEDILKQLMQVYPNNLTLLLESSTLSTLQNKFDEALENYHKILFLDPFNTEAKNAIEKISIIKKTGIGERGKPVDFVSYQKEKLHTADTLPEFDATKLRNILHEQTPVPPEPPPIPEIDEWEEKNEIGLEEFPGTEMPMPFNIDVHQEEAGKKLELPPLPLPFEEAEEKHETVELEKFSAEPELSPPPPPLLDWEEGWKEKAEIGGEDAALELEPSLPPPAVPDVEEAWEAKTEIGVEDVALELEPTSPPPSLPDVEEAWEAKANIPVEDAALELEPSLLPPSVPDVEEAWEAKANIPVEDAALELEPSLLPPSVPDVEEAWEKKAEIRVEDLELEPSLPPPPTLSRMAEAWEDQEDRKNIGVEEEGDALKLEPALPPLTVSEWEVPWEEKDKIGIEGAAAEPEPSLPPPVVPDWEKAWEEKNHAGLEDASFEPGPSPQATPVSDWEEPWKEKDQKIEVNSQWEEEIPGIEAKPEESLVDREEDNIDNIDNIAEAVKEESEIVTESAAELYIKQGLLEDALAIYRKLYESQKEKRYVLKINQLNYVLANQKKIQVLTELLKRIKQIGIGEQIV